MPTSEGRIYRDTSANPTKGVSLDDIGDCIGLSARDLGTLCQGMEGYEDHTTASQSSPLYKDIPEYRGLINNWSKAKPVWFTGANSLLPPKTSDNANLWEVRYRGNTTGASGRINDKVTPNAAFDTIYANEVPKGDKLYGSSTDSGNFLDSTGKLELGTNPTSTQVNDIRSKGGWIVDLMMDGNIMGITPVYSLRWRYNPPVTGASTFFQLDYDGYDQQSVNPLPLAENYYPIRVKFTKSGNTVTNISIPLSVFLPSPSGRDGITFDEVEAAIKARRLVDSAMTTVTNPSGSPFAKGYCVKVNGVYEESTDFSVQQNTTYYQAKGLSDMYLCALLYHRVANGNSFDDGISIDYSFWRSSTQKMSASGGYTVTMEIPNGNNGFGYLGDMTNNTENSLKNALLGTYDPGTAHDWRIKLFWCTKQIGQNTAPSSDGYVLLRGNDESPVGTAVTFVDADATSSSPYVSITSDLRIEIDDDFKSYYFSVNVVNPTSSQIDFTGTKVIKIISYMTANYSDPYVQSSNSASIISGGSYAINFGLGYQQSSDAYTGFLVYTKYGSGANDVCGAWIPISGTAIPFSKDDPFGNTWATVNAEYNFTLP